MATCFSLTKPVPLGINTSARVIKAAEYESMRAAEDLLSVARDEADAILARAHELAQLAIAKGFSQGMASARQETAEQLITAKIRANQMMQMAETDLVSLVKLTIEKLFGGIDEDKKIVSMIQSGLVSMRNDYRVLIRVAPAMEASVKAALPEFTKRLPGIEYFEVMADSKLPRDMCVLEGDGGIVKCSISEQFAKLNDLIEQALAET